MNILTLRNALTAAVAGDSALETWCQAKYGQSVSVYVGMDMRNPPGEDDYPLVHIVASGKVAGQSLAAIDHRFSVVCGVHDTRSESSTDAWTDHAGDIWVDEGGDVWVDHETNAGIVQSYGVTYVEELRALVQTAITGAVPAGCWVERIEVDYESVEMYPFFLAGMEITVSQPVYQGGDPLV